MKTQLSIIAVAMLLGTDAKHIRVLAQTKKVDDTVQPVNFAQTMEEPVAAAEPVVPLEETPSTTVPVEGSEIACRPPKGDSCSDHSDSCSAFGRVGKIRNQFKRFGLPGRRLRTSYITSGTRSKGQNKSYTVQTKPDEIRTDYSVTQGKGNGYSQTSGGNAAIKKKVFNIDGKITITEKTSGVSGEGSYNKNENAAKSKTKSVTYYDSAKKCKKVCKGGKHSDDSCDDYHFGASRSTPTEELTAASTSVPPVVENTPQ
jgi:hypothetical protein